MVDLYDSRDVEVPHVVLNIHFTKGLDMENLLVLKQDVALSIADLMMMGTGEVEDGKELGELELSAVQEAMNQMMDSHYIYVGILPRYSRYVSADD